jgi:hypothetical protein
LKQIVPSRLEIQKQNHDDGGFFILPFKEAEVIITLDPMDLDPRVWNTGTDE